MLADTLERMARKERRIRNISSFLSKNLLNDSFNLENADADDSHFNLDVETNMMRNIIWYGVVCLLP